MTEINLSLLARLHAVSAAFNRDDLKDAVFAGSPKASTGASNFKDLSLKDLVKKDDDDGKGGDSSGGSTAKGHRGKNDLLAKAVNAARRLGR